MLWIKRSFSPVYRISWRPYILGASPLLRQNELMCVFEMNECACLMVKWHFSWFYLPLKCHCWMEQAPQQCPAVLPHLLDLYRAVMRAWPNDRRNHIWKVQTWVPWLEKLTTTILEWCLKIQDATLTNTWRNRPTNDQPLGGISVERADGRLSNNGTLLLSVAFTHRKRWLNRFQAENRSLHRPLNHPDDVPQNRNARLDLSLNPPLLELHQDRPVFLISAIQYSKHGPNLSVLSRACWTWTLMSISSQPPIWLRLWNPSVSHTMVTQLVMWACEDPLASANDQLNHLNQPCSWSCSVISATFWGNSNTFSLGIHVMFQPSEPRLLWYQVGCAPTMRKQEMGIQRQGLHNLFFKTCLFWATCGNSDWSL